MESIGEVSRATAFDIRIVSWVTATCHDQLVALLLFTLVKDGSAPGRLKHDRVPGLSSGASHQGEEGIAKLLEVDMVAHLVSSVQVDGPELRDANDGEHKHQEHQEEAKGTHCWSRLDQRTEDDLQLFGLFDKSEDPTNPECSEDGGGHAQVGSHWQEALHDQDEDGEDHNSEIKDVPSVFEVGAPHGEDLDDSLKCESRHEEVVDVFEWQRIEVWLHVPIEGENQSVQQDQNHDC